jgi:hypothetical protein
MQIRIRDLVNPGSGMEKSLIRDKHPGSASLIFSCVYRLLEETRVDLVEKRRLPNLFLNLNSKYAPKHTYQISRHQVLSWWI